jgi:hypothetical protein
MRLPCHCSHPSSGPLAGREQQSCHRKERDWREQIHKSERRPGAVVSSSSLFSLAFSCLEPSFECLPYGACQTPTVPPWRKPRSAPSQTANTIERRTGKPLVHQPRCLRSVLGAVRRQLCPPHHPDQNVQLPRS